MKDKIVFIVEYFDCYIDERYIEIVLEKQTDFEKWFQEHNKKRLSALIVMLMLLI